EEPEVLGGRLPMLLESETHELGLNVACGLVSASAHELLQRWKDKSGATLEIRIRATPWFGPEKRRRGVFLMLTPVPGPGLTEEERARLVRQAETDREEALRFRALLEAAPDAIVKVDQAGRIVLMNRATETLFGYTREELIGQPVEVLVPPAARGPHIGQRSGYWKQPTTRPMGRGLTLSAVRKDGIEFPVEI